MSVTNVTAEEAKKEIKESEVPVLIKFWANWCGPCRMLTSVIDEVATESGDSAKVLAIDVDKEASLANELGITAIPYVGVFKGGDQVASLVGVQPKTHYIEAINSAALK